MAPSVQRYFHHGLAPSTQKTYQAVMKRFHAFCTRYNVGTPFPVTEHLLCCFAASLADQGLAPQTIKGYLSAVRNTQISLGFPDPRDQSSLPMLKRIQAGIQRIKSLAGPSTRTRLPITATLLRKIGQHLASSSSSHKELLWAVCYTAFFGFFRLGELQPEAAGKGAAAATVRWGDLAIDNRAAPSMVRIRLRRSKCDQFGRGTHIILGQTGCSISQWLR